MGLNKNKNGGNFNGEVGDMSNYATKSDLSTKVTKEEGKSLVDNTLIEKLENLENYDDNLIKEEIKNINSRLEQELNIDYDSILFFDTKEEIDYLEELPIIGYVNDDKEIILEEDLSGGTYYIKYEYKNGSQTLVEEFCIQKDNLINLLTTAQIDLNKRYSKSQQYVMSENGSVSIVAPIETNGATEYVLTFKNLPCSLTSGGGRSVSCLLDENQLYLGGINGVSTFAEMTTGIEISDNGLNTVVKFTPNSNVKYIAISVFFGSTNALTNEDLENLIITLEY